ncbi:DNA-binding transcriptional response regulator, NtrC family, contains REC, AAA-type ATPase, and a Fis-type DNA-binding domains [Neolewinella agarilytica]|uniref:DNA-binding transcriptional response regulator, NtrC family, contains REC, AAA-type ATPase, and a Fis-type DNA-binding domains n=1 Tax=Neolewinella agarilytica TaxID=478744 RepID=A0A1H9MJD0_9BACT|nr:sigma-54 dependent transcriptional regulator [Neolewinella agarilytica]SER23567.1 DNA-binding transcriptional response regulator, NtrC family, contains REC, AAA-type ATPase, and a Fis-type DNA-binding domains [Neolewinella agarilytica]
MDSFKIFIVEDDPFYGRLLKHHLSLNPDYEVELFTSGKACLQELYQKPDVVSIDYGLPDMDGGVLLNKIHAVNSSIPVIIISGQEDITTAVDLLKKGARDYLVKDDNTKELLWRSIINIRENSNLKQEVETLKVQLEEKFSFDSIIGSSKAMQKVYAILKKAIKSNINVSITGETGTGKEVIAKAIHYNSDRSKQPFVAVNMAAIPENLLESELFGHEKGAFTGAIGRKPGKFEQAKEGTLFLDEIAEMDLSLQSKILRAIQEREFTRVGGTDTIKFKARLLTATHRDLEVQVREGKFREDLYYRIMGLPIALPALKDRDEDVLLLAEFFIKQYSRENKTGPLKLNRSGKEKLLKYHFPGNVRELKAVIELACVMTDTNGISDEDIRFSGLNSEPAIVYGEKTLREYTLEIVRHYLEKYNNNVVQVAEKLGVGKSTIYNMLKNGELDRE